MEALFLQILSMSISASWLIVAVILIRFLLKKAPKGFRYVLWALVAVRLLCPVYIESDFSLIPSQDVIADVGTVTKPMVPVTPGISDGDHVVPDGAQNDNVQNNEVQNQNSQGNQGQINNIESIILPDNEAQDNSSQNTVTAEKWNVSTVMAWIWLIGMVALFIYAVVSYGLLSNTTKASIQKEDNLWVCDGIQSPFILGLIHPQIYLPSYIEEGHIPYIVAHEKEHIRCKDNWWKPLGYILLTIHWFNPLVWVAYILMCKDIELACDERVIRTMGAEDKKNYSKSLLLCSNPKHFISACPVAFGEVGVKERIKKIVDYRKPSVWIVGIGILVCLIIVLGFMTDPKEKITDVAKISLRGGNYYEVDVEITDEETISYITEMVNDMTFVPTGLNAGHGGWSYWLEWYDADGNRIESFLILGDNKISKDPFFYRSINGAFDTDFLDELIEKEHQRLEELQQSIIMTPLSEDELQRFETDIFNKEDDIRNCFLNSVYSSPQAIDLYKTFYGGVFGELRENPTQEEIDLLVRKYNLGEDTNSWIKISTDTMDAVLRRYVGIGLDETQKIGLDKFYYLEEYDAYYNIAPDVYYPVCEIEGGFKNEEEGVFILQYYHRNADDNAYYEVMLKEIKGNYCFVFHRKIYISETQLKWFESDFFNNDEKRIRNMFLTSEYEKPEDIDLSHLFYHGANAKGGYGEITQEEIDLLMNRNGLTEQLDVSKTEISEMNAVLQKYMGISFEDTNKVGLGSLYYLEEYDAYYNMAGDTKYSLFEILEGWYNKDGTISFLYQDKLCSIMGIYQVTLRNDNGTYYFISNIRKTE